MKSNKNYIKLLQLLGGITTCVCINACHTKPKTEDNAKAKQIFEDQISTSELFQENPSAKEDFKKKYEYCLGEIISSESDFKYWNEKFCGQTDVDTFDQLDDRQKENFVDNFIKLCYDHNSKSSDAADQVSVENLKEYAKKNEFSAINSEPGNEAGEKAKDKKDKELTPPAGTPTVTPPTGASPAGTPPAGTPDPNAVKIAFLKEFVKDFDDDTKLSDIFKSKEFNNQYHLILKVNNNYFDLNIFNNFFNWLKNSNNNQKLNLSGITKDITIKNFKGNLNISKRYKTNYVKKEHLLNDFFIVINPDDVYNKKLNLNLLHTLVSVNFVDKFLLESIDKSIFFNQDCYTFKDNLISIKKDKGNDCFYVNSVKIDKFISKYNNFVKIFNVT